MTPFAESLSLRLRAGFGVVKVVSRDQRAAIREMYAALGDTRFFVWSCARGFTEPEEAKDGSLRFHEALPTKGGEGKGKPIRDPLRMLGRLGREVVASDEPAVYVLCDMDDYFPEPEIRRALVEIAEDARLYSKLVVLLSRHSTCPPDLSDEISSLAHPLPDTSATRETIISTLDGAFPFNGAMVSALSGLTRTRQIDALALAMVEADQRGSEEIDLSILRRYKETEIGRLDFLEVREPQKRFADILGHGYLKEWLMRMRLGLAPDAAVFRLPVPKGMLLAGPPGTGKTRLAEALAAEWAWPFLTLNFARIFGKYVGESEENMALALEIAERMAPCVLLLDEIDKATGGDANDSGVRDQVVSQLLRWASLRTTPVFLVFTSNDPTTVDAALLRSGRIDDTFFIDFPSAEEREAIFRYYLGDAPVDVGALAPLTEQWSGADIEAAVGQARLAAYADGPRQPATEDLLRAVERTVVMAESRPSDIERMRSWASMFAKSSETGERAAAAPKEPVALRTPRWGARGR